MDQITVLAVIGTINVAMITLGLRRSAHPPDVVEAIRQALGPLADDEHRDETDRRLTRIETVLQSLESSVHVVLSHLRLDRGYAPGDRPSSPQEGPRS